jgi:hypothetical protein
MHPRSSTRKLRLTVIEGWSATRKLSQKSHWVPVKGETETDRLLTGDVSCEGAPTEIWGLQALTGPPEIFGRPSPKQIINGSKYRNIDSKCRERAEQERILPRSGERVRKGARSPQGRIPAMPVFRNIF